MDVKNEEGRTWIDGVDGFSTGEYASSPHGCQARILQAVGEALDYEDLLGNSGFAFRVQTHEVMCPSAGHPCCGYSCTTRSDASVPWLIQRFESFPDGPSKKGRSRFEADAHAAIRASIDRGVPVHYGSEEDGLIIGYSDEGLRWWCLHPYHRSGTVAFWHDEVEGFPGGSWPWGIDIWTEPKPDDQRADERDLTHLALKQAIEMWNAEKVHAYAVGEAAYTRWLEWLRGVDRGTVDDPLAGMQGNGWCFEVLMSSRRVAARWLHRRMGLFTGDAAIELGIAADHYAQIANQCAKDLASPWDLAMPPRRVAEWTQGHRQDQVRQLEAARANDRAAIAAIGRVVATL